MTTPFTLTIGSATYRVEEIEDGTIVVIPTHANGPIVRLQGTNYADYTVTVKVHTGNWNTEWKQVAVVDNVRDGAVLGIGAAVGTWAVGR